ncbi:MAG: HEPN domain-containing protein [Lachnospiraceae bacterium]|nr:HEPN domain-containing protein [Lachnospiraceae bacterium]
MESSIVELSRYRYEASLEALSDAKIMYKNGRYKNALNRSYYSIFHSIRAINSLDGFDSSKHSGVIAHFNQEYVKKGIFSKEASKLIKLAAENREKADYLDFFVASKSEAEKQIERACRFNKMIKDYLVEEGILEPTQINELNL